MTKKLLARRFYFELGILVGCWLTAGTLGFMMDVNGLEAWQAFERKHWTSAWFTMPVQAVQLASGIVLWLFGRRRSSQDDRTK